MRNFRLFLLVLLFLILPVRSFAQLTSQGNEQIISYAGSTAFILNNSPVNPNLLVNTGTNTFIMNVNPPTNAVRIYLTNDTANACSNLTVSIASAGNNSLNSFNQNLPSWQSVQVQTGAAGSFAATAPITLPASGTVVVTSAPILGTKIAVFIVLSSGCATTNSMDVEAVFGTFTPATGFVQGVVAPGTSATSINPLLIGTKDSQTGLAVMAESISPTGETTSSRGLSVGGGNQGFGTTWTGNSVRAPAAVVDGPMAVTPVFPIGVNGGSPSLQPHAASMSHEPCTSNCSMDALLVSDAGSFSTTANVTFTTTGQQISLWNISSVGGTLNGEFQTCHFSLYVTAVSGTTPTMDVFIQDSGDNVSWDDRIHFPQITAPIKYTAGIAGTSTNQPIAVVANRTIAANTIVSGPLDGFGQLVVVIGGTSPSFTTTIVTNCK